MCMEDGSLHRFGAHPTIIATRGFGRAVLSGDTGAIGLVTAEHLVQEGAKYLSLLSRSGKPSVGAKALWDGPGTSSVTVAARSCDCANLEAVQELGVALKSDFEARTPKTTMGAVIQLAAVLDDAIFPKLTPAHLHKSFGAKVWGARHLHFVPPNCPAMASKDTTPAAIVAGTTAARPEVAASAKVLAAEAVAATTPAAKAKAAATPPATKEAASAALQPVKSDKAPVAAAKAAGQATEILPAAVPSPSMVGASAAPTMAKASISVPGGAATFRQTPVTASTAKAAPAPLQAANQTTGAAPGGCSSAPTAALAAAAACIAAKQPAPAPRQAVEIVTRAPTAATASLPPSTVPVETLRPRWDTRTLSPPSTARPAYPRECPRRGRRPWPWAAPSPGAPSP